MIMSCFSTYSALNWRLIWIKETGMFPESFCFWSPRLFCPQHWWIGLSIISELILYNWEKAMFIYLLHAFVPVIFMHMLLENIREKHFFPFSEVSNGMPARILIFLPPSTRTCFFLDSDNLGFHSSWTWWRRHNPLLLLPLCGGFRLLLIKINIQHQPICLSNHIFLSNF